MTESFERSVKEALEHRAAQEVPLSGPMGVGADITKRRKRRRAARMSAVALASVAVLGGVWIWSNAMPGETRSIEVVQTPDVTQEAKVPLDEASSWRHVPALVALAPTQQEAIDVHYAEELTWAHCMRDAGLTISRVEPSTQIKTPGSSWGVLYSFGLGRAPSFENVADLEKARPLPVPNKNLNGMTKHPDAENLSPDEDKRWQDAEYGDRSKRVVFANGSSPGDGCLAAKYQATFADGSEYVALQSAQDSVFAGLMTGLDNIPPLPTSTANDVVSCIKGKGVDAYYTSDGKTAYPTVVTPEWDGNPATEAAAEERLAEAENARIVCEQKYGVNKFFYSHAAPRLQKGFESVQADGDKLVAIKNARVEKARQVIAELAPLEPAK